MTALLKACSLDLATHFGSQREYGTGISGATQLLGWTFTLANELEPRGVNLWVNITNWFNSVSRSAIETGLSDLPPSLSWLRRSFHSFYAESVPLYYTRNHDTQSILR
jgi:hypothetical protein